MNAISTVHGRQIFDSRGRPTVEVEITPRHRHRRPRLGALRRLHRHPRGPRVRATATRTFFDGLGVHLRRRARQRRDRRRAARPRRARPAGRRPGAARARRHPEPVPARRQRRARHLAGDLPRLCRRRRAAAVPAHRPARRRRRAGHCRCRWSTSSPAACTPAEAWTFRTSWPSRSRATSVLEAIQLTSRVRAAATEAVRRAGPAHPARRRGRPEPGLPHRAGSPRAARPVHRKRRPHPGYRHRHRHRRGRHLAVRPARRRLPPAPPGTAPEHRRR